MKLNLAAFIQIFLSIIFLASALSKFMNPLPFRRTLEQLGVASKLVPLSTRVVPTTEFIVAVFIVVEETRILGQIGIGALLLSFSWSVWRARGKELDCNCFGNLLPEQFGMKTMARILLLAAMVVYLFVYSQPTGLQGAQIQEWLAALFITLSILTGYGLLSAMHQFRKTSLKR
ncbi:MauE/DoxX family redox-associated membrane protein [Paenibacillus arenosi]|uniref:Methylamine utilisation protein MauE domain-containing protein n=1 Tax=Paenibacillus arenosi TaxID=2774142 RepID=A0ABR9B1F8_9BACL|nr:MauE/DoxX family redox-associated membrane protein [Paenibacillus arenosi]MBD8499011.1 hypothetical protein [Paenibacillus arenosi]